MTIEEMTKGLRDRHWRLNHLYRIIDDHGKPIPYVMNDVQEELHRTLWHKNLILKSRQHGVTTFFCILFLDAVLFENDIRAGIIAHKFKDVQRIFRDKIKYPYDNLPPQLLKLRPALKDDACELLLNNNSSVYVSTSMRSGTLQYMLVSEYGYVCEHAPQKAREIKTGALETLHEGSVEAIESTAEGMGNDFHSMCETAQKQTGALTRLDYRFHFFPWYKKPENVLSDAEAATVQFTPENLRYFAKIEYETGDAIDLPHRAWYARKKLILKEDMYKEHPSTPEEAFMASIEGSYYGRLLVKAQEEGRIGHVAHDETAKVYCFWDIGDMHTAIWFTQFIQMQIRHIDYYQDNNGLGLPAYAKVLQSKPYIYGGHYIGPDILGSNRKSMQTGKTTMDVAAELGIHFDVVEPHRIEDRIEAGRGIFPMCWFDKNRCAEGIKGLANYRKEKNELLSTEEITVFQNHPLHDWASHSADGFGHEAMAYRYMAIGDVILGYQGAKPSWSESYQDGVRDLLSV